MARGPIDAIPPAARRHTASPWRVFAACLCGSTMALLLCAREAPAWAERRAPGLEAAAVSLNSLLAKAGLTAPYDAIHRFIGQATD